MEQLRTALKCLATCIVASLVEGHIYCHLHCTPESGCDKLNFCLSVQKLVEEELNVRQKAQDHKVP